MIHVAGLGGSQIKGIVNFQQIVARVTLVRVRSLWFDVSVIEP